MNDSAPVLENDLGGDPRFRVLALNEPRTGNSLSAALLQALVAAVRRAQADASIRVLVLAARGKYFCTGMRLDPSALPSSGGSSSLSDNVFAVVRDCPLPTIALLQGPAMGGGIGLALACDMRVAVSGAWWSFPEVHRGIAPALISQMVVPALGSARARRYMMTGERIPMAELAAAGVVATVVASPGDLEAEATRLCGALVRGGPQALSNVKALVDRVGRAPHLDAAVSDYVQGVFAAMMQSEEAAEGITAFAARRDPSWVHQKAKL
ncbi:hypothetical protein H9P43_001744 [Blastocladiella emersonii ATCC 22665]|nr:hypothetical protein H9P43_001744 [Blastocladiella emersonii ATCC 22665]